MPPIVMFALVSLAFGIIFVFLDEIESAILSFAVASVLGMIAFVMWIV